jgi:ABC-type nitrate/sulfonate/bicarbonate transport system permease component
MTGGTAATIVRRVGPPAGLALLILALWEAAVAGFRIPSYILPPPTQVARLLVAERELLGTHFLVTLEEVLAGLVVACVVGIGLGIAIFHSPTLERGLYPFIIASKTVPIFAIAPLLIVWFGYGMAPKVIVAALFVFFPIVVNTVDGLKAVDPDAVNLLRIAQASQWQILTKVRLPAALPFIFAGLKIGVSVAVIGAVVGEWVGAKAGLGFLMIHANAQLQIDLIFAAIAALSALGVGLFGLVSLLEAWAMPWRRVAR